MFVFMFLKWREAFILATFVQVCTKYMDLLIDRPFFNGHGSSYSILLLLNALI